MMRMRSWLFLTFSISSAAFGLKISEIPSLVKTGNEEVRAAEKDVEAAAQGIKSARSRHYPSLSIKSTLIHLGDEIKLQPPSKTFDLPGGGILAVTLPPIEINKQDFYFSRAVVTLPIFAGGRISAGVDAAKAQREEARFTLTKIEEDKLEEALTRYFNVQLARRALDTLLKMKENLDRIQSISEKLVKAGLGPKFSILQVKVAQADLVSRIAEAQGKSALADLAFKNSTGKPSASVVTYETPLKKLGAPARIDTFKTSALQNRKEFKILSAKDEQVQALKALHEGEMLPTLYAVGSHNILSNNLTVLEPQWAVGVVLEIPLTTVFSALPERERAVKLQEKVEILRNRAQQEIPLQIEKIYTEVQATDHAHQAIEESLGLAKEALRLAEVRFKNGDGSALEVLRTATDLEKAEIRELQLAEEFNRKLIELYHAAGELDRYIDSYEKGKNI